jgi:hypothetical protein
MAARALAMATQASLLLPLMLGIQDEMAAAGKKKATKIVGYVGSVAT